MGKQFSSLTLEVTGGILKGISVVNGVEQHFTGTTDGSHAEWALDVVQPFKMTLGFTVDVEGDAMTGKVKTGMLGSFPLTGCRTV
ncbi:hypothetical protein ASE85_10910 [Sphingobium sp. Leaf26]|nr:hypothetical protein ASE85_10910 [Sphingobium sp. Leaf26]